MNIDLGEIFKSATSLLVVLGVILILIAAMGDSSIGNQITLSIDVVWRYI